MTRVEIFSVWTHFTLVCEECGQSTRFSRSSTACWGSVVTWKCTETFAWGQSSNKSTPFDWEKSPGRMEWFFSRHSVVLNWTKTGLNRAAAVECRQRSPAGCISGSQAGTQTIAGECGRVIAGQICGSCGRGRRGAVRARVQPRLGGLRCQAHVRAIRERPRAKHLVQDSQLVIFADGWPRGIVRA